MIATNTTSFWKDLYFLKNKIERIENDAGNQGVWQVRLKAPAVDGKANERLVEYLSKVLDLPKSKILLVKGQTARIKCVEIMAVEQDILARLEKEAGYPAK